MSYSDRFASARSAPRGLYYFMAGLLLGLVLGWMFHGVIGLAIRLLVLVVVVAVLYFVYTLWRRTQPPRSAPYDDIPDANWRELDPTRRRNRERDVR
jgi:predicted lipid-binding transport protein (Tim44 family)